MPSPLLLVMRATRGCGCRCFFSASVSVSELEAEVEAEDRSASASSCAAGFVGADVEFEVEGVCFARLKPP
jgi:hypothetical protein